MQMGGCYLGRTYLGGRPIVTAPTRRVRRTAALGRAWLGKYYMGDEFSPVAVSNVTKEILVNTIHMNFFLEESIVEPEGEPLFPAGDLAPRVFVGGRPVFKEFATLTTRSKFSMIEWITEVQQQLPYVPFFPNLEEEELENIIKLRFGMTGKTRKNILIAPPVTAATAPFKSHDEGLIIIPSESEQTDLTEDEIVSILVMLGEL